MDLTNDKQTKALAEKLQIFSIFLSLSFISYYIVTKQWWIIFWIFNLAVNTTLFIHQSQTRGRLYEHSRKIKKKAVKR